jgi:hypothetical protein
MKIFVENDCKNCTQPQPVPKSLCLTAGKGEGNAILVQAWRGPEGSTRLRFPDFKAIDI